MRVTSCEEGDLEGVVLPRGSSSPATRGGSGGACPGRNAPEMKKIEAIIKPFKLEEVKSGLAELGIEGMTVSEVKGYGHPLQSSRPPYAPSRLPFIPKLKVELIVKNELLGS